MTSSNKLLSKLFLALSLIGFADALYLTVDHYLNRIPPCVPGFNCELVLTSQYATIVGVPIALFGVLYYLAIFALTIMALQKDQARYLKFAWYLACLGFLASLYLFYLQIFVIGALCFFCVISAVISTLLFVSGFWIKNA